MQASKQSADTGGSQDRYASLAAFFGFATVGLFVASFFVFAYLNAEFDPVYDYISKLGARGEPYASGWNLLGFIAVGTCFSLFGWCLGRAIADSKIGILLILAGLGFALGAVPTDLADTESPLSKAHFVSICLSMAAWCFALARMNQAAFTDLVVKSTAKLVAVLTILPIAAAASELLSSPMAHRLSLGVVFGWVLWIAIRLRGRRIAGRL